MGACECGVVVTRRQVCVCVCVSVSVVLSDESACLPAALFVYVALLLPERLKETHHQSMGVRKQKGT